ncbi:uncharacterized protein LOC120148852 [Hibiscus syriacus]|uniref:uncharacterized protein LOC120148852 n=1 Tax=Hibiscus syriacus TaxID=106335 RepID=UPI001923369C|nr:uncharacterized protein LOC120148852 [Hibiscus syriacus]
MVLAVMVMTVVTGLALNNSVFSNKRVSVTLDKINYLLWKQQILLTVRSHRLKKLLTGNVLPPAATVVLGGGVMVEKDEYEVFVTQYNALASWLLSTIDPSILPHLVGAETAEIWMKVTIIFANKSPTVKEVCDVLTACGAPVSEYEQIVTVLNGLPPEYRPFVVVITTSSYPLSFDRIASMLVDAEM